MPFVKRPLLVNGLTFLFRLTPGLEHARAEFNSHQDSPSPVNESLASIRAHGMNANECDLNMSRGHWIFKIVSFGILSCLLISPEIGWVTKAEAKSEMSLFISVEGDRVTAKIEYYPLREVLNRLSQMTALEVTIPGAVGEKPVSVEFEGLSMEDGLQRILKGENYALTYADSGGLKESKASAKVVGIRVISKDDGFPMIE
jgi:hypothetical protein